MKASGSDAVEIYLEVSQKRAIAGALRWPGWARSAPNEAAALASLRAYAPRYAAVVQPALPDFVPPEDLGALAVVERLVGNATTDYGVPGMAPAYDGQPLDAAELARLTAILQACWRAFDTATMAAAGVTLRSGPRGGGRNLEKMVGHVVEAEASYAGSGGWKYKLDTAASQAQQLADTHQAILDALAAGVRGELETRGPRGGMRWPPRYLARRVAWHVLDHAWEIEDRSR